LAEAAGNAIYFGGLLGLDPWGGVGTARAQEKGRTHAAIKPPAMGHRRKESQNIKAIQAGGGSGRHERRSREERQQMRREYQNATGEDTGVVRLLK